MNLSFWDLINKTNKNIRLPANMKWDTPAMPEIIELIAGLKDRSKTCMIPLVKNITAIKGKEILYSIKNTLKPLFCSKLIRWFKIAIIKNNTTPNTKKCTWTIDKVVLVHMNDW